MTVSDTLLQNLKNALRTKNTTAEWEIKLLVSSCITDLSMSGVYVTTKECEDGVPYQAIKLYCKANYGYDDNVDRFREAYEALKNSMALSGDYR